MLWADAVCMNQNDIPENNTQVLLMAKVYSMAAKVLVWLGRPVHRPRITPNGVRASAYRIVSRVWVNGLMDDNSQDQRSVAQFQGMP